MMITGMVTTGHAAIGAATMPPMGAMSSFEGAGMVLGTFVCATLVTGFFAICMGAMRQLSVPTVRSIHGPATLAHFGSTQDLAMATRRKSADYIAA